MKGSYHIHVCVMITPAEHKVLRELTWDGPTNYEIAKRLFISEDTVKSHLRNVTARIPHIKNRTALVTALLRQTVTTRVMEPSWTTGYGPRATYNPTLIRQGGRQQAARRSADLAHQ